MRIYNSLFFYRKILQKSALDWSVNILGLKAIAEQWLQQRKALHAEMIW